MRKTDDGVVTMALAIHHCQVLIKVGIGWREVCQFRTSALQVGLSKRNPIFA
jgi:hypothetical protein